MAQQLRYIDLFFESVDAAQKELDAQGVMRRYVLDHEREPDSEAKAYGIVVGDYAARLIGERAAAEGLPFSVLTTDKVRAAYLEAVSLMGAPEVVGAPKVAA
jgi:hypothetical protein